MYERIHEAISVAGVYHTAHFIPHKFQWRNKEYRIQDITLVYNSKDGGVRSRIFSVMAEGNLYRLTFNRETEVWKLEEIWMEG